MRHLLCLWSHCTRYCGSRPYEFPRSWPLVWKGHNRGWQSNSKYNVRDLMMPPEWACSGKCVSKYFNGIHLSGVVHYGEGEAQDPSQHYVSSCYLVSSKVEGWFKSWSYKRGLSLYTCIGSLFLSSFRLPLRPFSITDTPHFLFYFLISQISAPPSLPQIHSSIPWSIEEKEGEFGGDGKGKGRSWMGRSWRGEMRPPYVEVIL